MPKSAPKLTGSAPQTGTSKAHLVATNRQFPSLSALKQFQFFVPRPQPKFVDFDVSPRILRVGCDFELSVPAADASNETQAQVTASVT
eukprot:1517522-Rhodomonas_salina.1